MSDQSDVAADLRQDGFPMVLSRVTPGAYDPVTGFGAGVTEEWLVYGILGSYKGNEFATGTVIKMGDKKAIVEAGVVAPAPGDTLTINGAIWKVITVDAVNPQGVDLMYRLQVRV
jgi:hypothetical protein